MSDKYPRPPGLDKPSPERVQEQAEVEAIATKNEEILKGLSGTKTLIAAPAGAGKTYSLVTAIKAGLELFVVGTEPNFEESLLEAVGKLGVDESKLHYAYVAPSAPSWDDLLDMGRKINNMSYEDITKLKSGVAKAGHRQFLDLVSLLANFKDQRGVEYGPVDKWGADRMLAVDSLSGVNEMAMALVIGGKPAAHQGEWGVAMNAEDKLLQKLCSDTRCFFTLTAHIDREMDEVIGRPMLSVSALGRKLGPKIPRRFSDFITAYNEGGKFFWSTSHTNMDLKTRTLPFGDKLEPSFVPIVQTWKRRRHNGTAQ